MPRVLRIENCIDCPHHRIERDPDYSDSFCSDDVKVVCGKVEKNITEACRPYRVRHESEIPNWCPLEQENR